MMFRGHSDQIILLKFRGHCPGSVLGFTSILGIILHQPGGHERVERSSLLSLGVLFGSVRALNPIILRRRVGGRTRATAAVDNV